LKATSPGYKTFEVKPILGGGLSFANATLDSPHGLIAVGWRIENGELTVEVTAPAGASGQIVMPDSSVVAVPQATSVIARSRI
jgi:alpha-L-rhamnosidase